MIVLMIMLMDLLRLSRIGVRHNGNRNRNCLLPMVMIVICFRLGRNGILPRHISAQAAAFSLIAAALVLITVSRVFAAALAMITVSGVVAAALAMIAISGRGVSILTARLGGRLSGLRGQLLRRHGGHTFLHTGCGRRVLIPPAGISS